MANDLLSPFWLLIPVALMAVTVIFSVTYPGGLGMYLYDKLKELRVHPERRDPVVEFVGVHRPAPHFTRTPLVPSVTKTKEGLEPVTKELLEKVAGVIGPASAAAAALAEAAAHDGPVKFWTTGHSFVVEKLPKERP